MLYMKLIEEITTTGNVTHFTGDDIHSAPAFAEKMQKKHKRQFVVTTPATYGIYCPACAVGVLQELENRRRYDTSDKTLEATVEPGDWNSCDNCGKHKEGTDWSHPFYGKSWNSGKLIPVRDIRAGLYAYLMNRKEDHGGDALLSQPMNRNKWPSMTIDQALQTLRFKFKKSVDGDNFPTRYLTKDGWTIYSELSSEDIYADEILAYLKDHRQ